MEQNGSQYLSPVEELLKHPEAIRRYRGCAWFLYWEDFLKYLKSIGFTSKTRYEALRCNFRFYLCANCWGISRLEDIRHGHYKRFLSLERVRFLRRYGKPPSARRESQIAASVRGFLEYAFARAGLVWHGPAAQASHSIPAEILDDFECFCRLHRGLKEGTLRLQRSRLIRLGRFLDRKKVVCIRNLTLAHLDAFLFKEAARLGRKTLWGLVSVLRQFLKYLFLHDKIPIDWGGRLMIPRIFRGELRPKYIPWSEVQRFLAGIDQSTPGGKRDHAIVTLLAAYGLRGREVVSLKLDDVDWSGQRLTIRHRKGGYKAVFALRPEVECALKSYIHSARPRTAREEIFVTTKAPIVPLCTSTFSAIVQRHLHRFSSKLPFYGAYLLRHSFAKALMDRGADMQTIGNLLGHRHLETTLVYTRVATEDLREVADNYGALL